MFELTTEQLEYSEKKAVIEKLKNEVKFGKHLEKLRKMPEFQELILDLFLTNGKNILWENIRYLTEGQMKGLGSDKNLEMIEKIKGQVQSRVDLEGFFDTVEHDAENAKEELTEMEKE